MRKVWSAVAKDLWIVLLDIIAVNAAYYLALLIRFFGNMNEGVSYSILIMNLLVPFINSTTRRTPLGGEKIK